MYFRKSRFYFYAKSLPLNAKALKVIGEQQFATPENEIHLICFYFSCGLMKNISHFWRTFLANLQISACFFTNLAFTSEKIHFDFMRKL